MRQGALSRARASGLATSPVGSRLACAGDFDGSPQSRCATRHAGIPLDDGELRHVQEHPGLAPAAGSGGGLLNDGGSLLVANSKIEDNTATRAGGGVEADAGSTVLRKVKLRDNDAGSAPGNGGGLHLTGAGTVLVVDGDVMDNVAAAEGGGLWNSATGVMNVVNTHVIDNTASGLDPDQGGGGLFNDGGRLNVDDSVVRGNVADGTSGSGGGILNNLGSLFVIASKIQKNESQRAGGGIETNAGFVSLIDVKLVKNATGANPGNGGGLHVTGEGSVAIEDGAVVGNDAANEGGGLWNSDTGSMTVDGTKIKGNDAAVGDDTFNDGGTFLVDGEDVLP